MTMHDKDMMPVYLVTDSAGFALEVFEDEHEANLYASLQTTPGNMHRVRRLDLHFKDRGRNAEAQSYYL